MTSAHRTGHRRASRHRRKLGVSPVIAETILIAIAVGLGVATWSFVNGAAGSQAQAYGTRNAQYINFLNERLSIAHIDFLNSTTARVWVLNSGEFDTFVRADVTVVNATVPASPNTMCVTSPQTSVPKGDVAQFNVSISPGAACPSSFTVSSYFFTIVGQFDNRDSYLAAKST